MNIKNIAMVCIAAAAVTSCGNQQGLKSLNTEYLCDSIAPGEDFYDYVTLGNHDFNFGTADFGKPNSGSGGSGTGGGDSGTASVSSVILHKNKDADYEEASSQNELRP